MKKLFITGLAAASATLAACSENPVTPLIADGGLSPLMATVVTQETQRVCSVAGGGFFAIPTNANWSAPIDADPLAAGNQGTYVGPSANSQFNYTPGPTNPTSYGTYLATFTLPSNASNISISGNLFVDNDVTIAVNGGSRFFSTFPGTGNPGDYTYPAGVPDNRTLTNFHPGDAPANGLSFSTSSGFTTGSNTVAFTLYNDNNPNTNLRQDLQDTNPTGLSFCFNVNYTVTTQTQDGTRGCSPGYWKNHGYPNGVTPGTSLASVGFNYGGTFDQALNAGGGGVVALMRHAASAYLNATIFGASNYGMSAADVVLAVNQAIAQGGSAISALSDKLEGMEDVNGRICDAGTPNTNGGGKKK